MLKSYVRREKTLITAVRLNLSTAGFAYEKWGHAQHCKPGDWIVDNNGDIYTIDAASFATTYREVSPGRYEKSVPIWARQADSAGSIATKEGATAYQAGDYLVYNNPDQTDGYAVAAAKFATLYQEVAPGA